VTGGAADEAIRRLQEGPEGERGPHR